MFATGKLFFHKAAVGALTVGGYGRGGSSVLIGPQAELDNGAGVGDQLGLPSIIALVFLHGGFGLAVPVTGGIFA